MSCSSPTMQAGDVVSRAESRTSFTSSLSFVPRNDSSPAKSLRCCSRSDSAFFLSSSLSRST